MSGDKPATKTATSTAVKFTVGTKVTASADTLDPTVPVDVVSEVSEDGGKTWRSCGSVTGAIASPALNDPNGPLLPPGLIVATRVKSPDALYRTKVTASKTLVPQVEAK